MDRPLQRFRAAFTAELEDNSDLERDRCLNDMRLKNAFENIFEKYSRDFTEMGDEVDLETGEIVVDNGHLSHMRDEQDTGQDDVGEFLNAFAEDLEMENELEVENTSTVDEDEVGTNDEDTEQASTDTGERIRYEGEDDQSDVGILPAIHRDANSGVLALLQSNVAHQSALSGSSAHNAVSDPAFAQPQMNTAALQRFGQNLASQIVQFMMGMQHPLPPVNPLPPLFGLAPQPPPPQPSPHPRRANRRWRPRSPPGRRSIWALPEPTVSERRKRKFAEAARPDASPRPAATSKATPRAVPGTANPQASGARVTTLSSEATSTPRQSHSVVTVSPSLPPVNTDADVDIGTNEPDAGYLANTKRIRTWCAWTPEDDQLLIELFENRRLPGEEVVKYFPGRTSTSAKSRYYRYLREPGPRRWYARGIQPSGESSPGAPSPTETPVVAPQLRESLSTPNNEKAGEVSRLPEHQEPGHSLGYSGPKESDLETEAAIETDDGNLLTYHNQRTSRPVRTSAGRRPLDPAYLNTVEVIPEGYSGDVEAETEEIEETEETEETETTEHAGHVEAAQEFEVAQDTEEIGDVEEIAMNKAMPPPAAPAWKNSVDDAKAHFTPSKRSLALIDQRPSSLSSVRKNVVISDADAAHITPTRSGTSAKEVASSHKESSEKHKSRKLSGLIAEDLNITHTTPKAPKTAGRVSMSSGLKSSGKNKTRMLSNFESPVLAKREVVEQGPESEDELAL